MSLLDNANYCGKKNPLSALVALNMNFVEGYVVWIPGAFQ